MNHSGDQLVFLKLGGSLITDKHKPRSARLDVIDRIAREITGAFQANSKLKIILGHGSGSFGHTSGKKHGTINGVDSREGWLGFAEVWHDASQLNNIVLDSLVKAGLPALAFPPSSSVTSQDRKIVSWDLNPLQSALREGLIPVVFGDVVFDTARGGTILSTEDLFSHLAEQLKPDRILLAGIDPGVWKDFPACSSLFKEITPADLPSLQDKIQQSQAPDVTGGMEAKVEQMLHLINKIPSLETVIFSGEEPGNIQNCMGGDIKGTVLHS
ncbi:MAG: isopentenyl phosphate kinase [Anaerolineales bacterium]|nr:isopentenyl phosphate kinase [Anaerolineales bacterium]